MVRHFFGILTRFYSPTDKLNAEVSVPFNLEENILGFYGFGFEGK